MGEETSPRKEKNKEIDPDSVEVMKLHDAVRLDDRSLIKQLLKSKTVH
jgi:hypothetical protein